MQLLQHRPPPPPPPPPPRGSIRKPAEIVLKLGRPAPLPGPPPQLPLGIDGAGYTTYLRKGDGVPRCAL